MALSCCVQLGNRDARHFEYSNMIKKNSVPLKEGLTQRRASTSRGSCEHAATCAHHRARSDFAVCISIRQDCRKCLRRSAFFDSSSTRCLHYESTRETRDVVNGAVRGLRVLSF